MKIILFNKKTNSNFLIKNLLSHKTLKIGSTLLVALIISYIFQISEMTRETYLVRDYDREIKEINEESRLREYSFLQANSLSRVQDSSFEKVDEVDYIEIVRPQVASK